MKKLFLIPVLGLLLAACTHDDSALDGNKKPGGATGPEGSQFLSVSIAATGSSTRATTAPDDAKFQDGTAVENYVHKVRFYFFTATGAAAWVKYNPPTEEGKDGTYQSYYDWYPGSEPAEGTPMEPGEDQNNIEKILTAKIIIDSEKSDKVPYSVVAVINPSEEYENEAGSKDLSLDELNSLLKIFNTENLTTKGNDGKGAFVMSNSVFMNNDGVVAEPVSVVSHIYKSVDAAVADPVIIYVERVVARLDFSLDLQNQKTDTEGIFKTKKSGSVIKDLKGGDDDIEYDGEIYVKFLGWNVTATPEVSRLMKSIDTSWDIDIFGKGNDPWNDTYRYRSYWAINPEGVEFNYGNFGQALAENPEGLKYADEGNLANANKFDFKNAAQKIVYMQENAAVFGGNGSQEPYRNTKVIIAGQLVKKDGTPLTLVEWGFNYYTIEGLKNLYANELNIYRKDGNTYTKIRPEDITFVTARTVMPEIQTPEAKGRYYVYPQLIDDKTSTWTIGNDQATAQEVGYAAANLQVQNMGPAKIWNNGYTYYYFDIEHLGATDYPGQYGVVRNHIYDAAVNDLDGLGTPVYDPNEVIYPEHPDKDNSMIAARINVLSWRVVQKGIQLQW